jgi:hypothetical protein
LCVPEIANWASAARLRDTFCAGANAEYDVTILGPCCSDRVTTLIFMPEIWKHSMPTAHDFKRLFKMVCSHPALSFFFDFDALPLNASFVAALFPPCRRESYLV